MAYPLAARSRRKRRERLLGELAPRLGAGPPVDVRRPWAKAPTRGPEVPWRGQRAAVLVEEVGRYDSYRVALLGPSLPRIDVRPETGVDRAGKAVGRKPPATAVDTRAGTMSIRDAGRRGSYHVDLLVTRVE